MDLEVFDEVVKASAAQSWVAGRYLHGRGSRDMEWMYYHILRDALELGQKYDIELPGAASCMVALAHPPRVGS